MTTGDSFDAERRIAFLTALVTDAQSSKAAGGRAAPNKAFLIMDNPRVHHSELVKAWLADITEKIEVFYLPIHSPLLNPDERLNAE